MLPYVEYARSVNFPDRNAYIVAIEQGILKADSEGLYADPQHFFDHALNAGETLTVRLPEHLMSKWTNALLEEPSNDGG